jgi:nucleoside-diphosphate-sugar epimerase
MLHLAWYVEPGKLISHVDNLRWLASSIDLVRAFRDAGGERCVVAGTCYEYDWRYGYCSEELTGTNAGTLYGASKNALRQVLEAYGAVDGLALAWGRVFFLYGPREHPRRLVSSVIAALLQGRTAPTSHGRQVRDYLYVQDVADGLVALLVSKEVGCFNICSGNALTLRDIVEKIGTLIGRPDLLQIGAVAARANDAPLVVGDGVRTARAVGWTPRFNLETGLLLTIDWWREQLKLPVQGAR